MTPPTTCMRCQGRLTRGFVVDNGYGTRTVSGWFAGEPVKSIWSGLKIKGKQRDIATWRCDRCGMLESYAG